MLEVVVTTDHVILDEMTKLKHDILTSHDAAFSPVRKSSFGGCHGRVHLIKSGTGYARHDLLSGRVVVVYPAISF